MKYASLQKKKFFAFPEPTDNKYAINNSTNMGTFI
jgi:hypothetical protein